MIKGPAVVAAALTLSSRRTTMTPNKGYRINLSGRIFGNWTVLCFWGHSGDMATWLCKCVCGALRHIHQRKLLYPGHIESCGCLKIRKGFIEDGVGYVPLTMGQVAFVDPQKVEEFNAWNWFTKKMDKDFYAYRYVGIDRGTPQSRIYSQSMARQILGLEEGNPLQADHINLDALDNRSVNLRIATQQQNLLNKRVRSDSTTGIKGVRLEKSGMYVAEIRYNGRLFPLGRSYDPEIARALYAAAAVKIHGEFARF